LTTTEADFQKMAERYYPGSTARVGSRKIEPKVSSRATEGLIPTVYDVAGNSVEFFTIGELAKALNRQAGTIRKWEKEGILPKSLYSSPSEDPRGVRRLYTRKQIEGIVKIAIEEQVFYPQETRRIKATYFTSKVIALFKELSQELG
jgi:hypothetical protein